MTVSNCIEGLGLVFPVCGGLALTLLGLVFPVSRVLSPAILSLEGDFTQTFVSAVYIIP